MLQDFLDHVGQEVIWNLGGRHGTYSGKLYIDEVTRCFALASGKGTIPILGNAYEETPFSRDMTINNLGQIVSAGGAK